MTLISFVPHSGFGNQMIALTNAVHVAFSANATLVLPKVLHHFDSALGACRRGISSIKQIADRYARVKDHRPSIDEYITVSGVHTTTRELACRRTVHLEHACGWDPIGLIRNRSLSHSCIKLGSTFIMRRPTDYSYCRISVKERWKQHVRERMTHFVTWDVAHFRLREGRARQLNTKGLRVENSSDRTPLVIITDNAEHATSIVAKITKRPIVLAQALFHKTIETEQIIIDATIAILARKFYPSVSTFSTFIKTQRRCLNVPETF